MIAKRLSGVKARPIGRAVVRAWLAAVAMIVLYCLAYGLWTLVFERGLAGLPMLLAACPLAGIMAAIAAFPSAVLLWVMMLGVEWRTGRPATLPSWLAAGAVAAIPAAWYLWEVDKVMEYFDNLNPQPPFAWVNLEFPMFLLVCGLIGGFFGCRARQAGLRS